uniref:Uncharacterized protein n=1 Tax=Panagrolaimus davidi TaxID=227884 RepID=A0A914P6S9_9BILA
MKRKFPDTSTEDVPALRHCHEDQYLKQFKASGLASVDVPHESLRKKMDDFSKKYLMPPSLWDLRTQCEPNMTYYRYVELTKLSLSDCYSKELFYDDPSFSIYNEIFRAQL